MKFYFLQNPLTWIPTSFILLVFNLCSLPHGIAQTNQAVNSQSQKKNIPSPYIDIYCYTLWLKSPLAKIKINDKEISNSECCDLPISHKKYTNIIRINRGLIKDSLKLKISPSGYQEIEIEINKSFAFKRINLYFNISKPDKINRIKGFVRNNDYKKIKDQSVETKKGAVKTKGPFKLYTLPISAVGDSAYVAFPKKVAFIPSSNSGVPIINLDPAYLIKFFNLKDNIRLDVVLDDGNKDSGTTEGKPNK